MSIFDFLKRKKEIEKSKKPVEKKPEKDVVSKETKAQVPTNKKAGKFSYNVIREPHISEKATGLAKKNNYTFKVAASANKPEIKKAVEGIYGVDVLRVNVIKIPKKKRRIGRTEGFKKGFSKAVVQIKEGQKIEIL